MPFENIENTIDCPTQLISIKAGAVATRSATSSNTRRRTKPLPKRDGTSSEKGPESSDRPPSPRKISPTRRAAKRKAIVDEANSAVPLKRLRVNDDTTNFDHSALGPRENEGLDRNSGDDSDSNRGEIEPDTPEFHKEGSSSPTWNCNSPTSASGWELPLSTPTTVSTVAVDAETIAAILNAAIGSASRVGIEPASTLLDADYSITPSLSPASAGDDEQIRLGSQPNAVDCTDSAIIADEWHSVFTREHLELDPLVYTERQQIWERNAGPYDVETSTITAARSSNAVTRSDEGRFTQQLEAELLALCKSKQPVTARSLIPRENMELVVKSQAGNKEEGAKLVATFLEKNNVGLAPLKNGKARTELHVCLMKASIVNGEFIYADHPCFLAPKRGVGLYATRDDLVRHQREHHLAISRPKEKSKNVAEGSKKGSGSKKIKAKEE